MRAAKRTQLFSRYQRFNLEVGVTAIVKNVRSRCACFWLGVANISASGVGLEYLGYGHIPFSVGDELNLTIDLSSAVFRRPIHIKAIVRRRDETVIEENGIKKIRVFLGIEILSVDPLHQKVWNDGLLALGDPFKMDPFSNKGS